MGGVKQQHNFLAEMENGKKPSVQGFGPARKQFAISWQKSEGEKAVHIYSEMRPRWERKKNNSSYWKCFQRTVWV